MHSGRNKNIWGTLDPFIEDGPIIGRKMANASFLRALFRADPFDEYHFFLPDERTSKTLTAFVEQAFPDLETRIRLLPRRHLPEQISRTPYAVFHLSDCLTSQGWLAALRNRYACSIFPITGVTHSLSYARYGAGFAQLVWAGTTPRDCVVATSCAGAAMVTEVFTCLATLQPGTRPPEVEIIPLGVDCAHFAATDAVPSAGKVTFLVPGRISPYSKMDLLPLLRAFQRLARQGRDLSTVCLILAGGVDEGEGLPGTLRNLAANIGLELRVEREPDERTKLGLFQQADVVVSLADNPQETFGLTLLEAAAAGKPVIASDYDGYRDLVRHEQTGLLVPTRAGDDELATYMAPLLYDSAAHLWLAQNVAVDVEVLAEGLERMFDPVERRRMGEAALLHARSFDWAMVLEKYVLLWERLAKVAVPHVDAPSCAHPLHMDYTRYFASYPSERLQETAILKITDLGKAVYRKQDFPVVYAGIEERIDLELMQKMLVWARKPVSVLQVLAKDADASKMRFTLVWMLKNDLLRVVR